MARVQFTIGAGSLTLTSFASVWTMTWRPRDGTLVLPASWFADPNERLQDRDLGLISLANSPTGPTLQLGDSSFSASGDLSDAAERSSILLTFQAPGWGPHTFVGPNSAGATRKDDSEPYAWTDSNYTAEQIRLILRDYESLSSGAKAQTVVIFNDNTFEANLSIPAPSFDIQLGVLEAARIVAGLRISAPTFDASLRIIPPPKRIEATLAIPAPAFAIRLATEEPIRIAPIEADLSIPAPSFDIQLRLLQPISFRAGLVIPAPTFSANLRTQYIPRELHAGFTIPALTFDAQLDLDTTPPELRDAETDWIVENLRTKADSTVVVTASAYREGLYTFPADRSDLENVEDRFAPETDFSQTPPEPLRDLTAETVQVDVGGINVPECAVTFLSPTENYGGTEIWLALGAGAPGLQTLEDPNSPGEARFTLPIDAGRYRVIAYSLNKERTLRGVPLEILVNASPIANAGFDINVNAGEEVTLNGSFSTDPDNDPLLFLWTQISGEPVTLSNPQVESPAFIAPSSQAMSFVLEFQLTVSDGLLTSTDSVIVNVRRLGDGEEDDINPDPEAPVVEILAPNPGREFVVGQTVTFRARATATEGKIITSTQWFALSPSRTLVSSSTIFVYQLPSDTVLTEDTDFAFDFVATDSDGLSTTRRRVITISANTGAGPPTPRNATLNIGRTATSGTFSWSALPAADYYEYRTNRAGTISNWIRTTATRITLEGGRYGNAASLFWAEVRACNEGGCSLPNRELVRHNSLGYMYSNTTIRLLDETRNIETLRIGFPFLHIQGQFRISGLDFEVEYNDLDEDSSRRTWVYRNSFPRGFDSDAGYLFLLGTNQIQGSPIATSTWDNNVIVRYRYRRFNAWGYSPWGPWVIR